MTIATKNGVPIVKDGVIASNCECCDRCDVAVPESFVVQIGNVVGEDNYRAINASTFLTNGVRVDQTVSYLFRAPQITGEYQLHKNTSSGLSGVYHVFEFVSSDLNLQLILRKSNTGEATFAAAVYDMERYKVLSGLNNAIQEPDMKAENWDDDCVGQPQIIVWGLDSDPNAYPACSIRTTFAVQMNQRCAASDGFSYRFQNTLSGGQWIPREKFFPSFLPVYLETPPDYPWAITRNTAFPPFPLNQPASSFQLKVESEAIAGDFSSNRLDYFFDIVSITAIYETSTRAFPYT